MKDQSAVFFCVRRTKERKSYKVKISPKKQPGWAGLVCNGVRFLPEVSTETKEARSWSSLVACFCKHRHAPGTIALGDVSPSTSGKPNLASVVFASTLSSMIGAFSDSATASSPTVMTPGGDWDYRGVDVIVRRYTIIYVTTTSRMVSLDHHHHPALTTRVSSLQVCHRGWLRHVQ